MTASDSELLNFFSSLAIFGCLVVFVGVFGESAEFIVKWGRKRRFRKRLNETNRRRLVGFVKVIRPKLLPIETGFFAVLVIGLAIEILGSFAAERMQSKANSELMATNILISLQIEQFRSTNFVLQAKVLNLEAAAKDRTITDVQSNLFMILIKDYPQTPIKVFVGVEDYETDMYARKIRQMLDAAGYGDNGGDIIRIPGGIVTGPISAQGQFSSNAIAFITYGNTNKMFFMPMSIPPNGTKPVISSGLTNDVDMFHKGILGCVGWAFSKIDLNGMYILNDTLLKPGEVGIVVPLKNH